MNRAEEKAQRLLQIEKLLWAHPEGLTRAEIARRVGVDRSTITRYLNAGQLPPGIYEVEDGTQRLMMDKDADLTRASFSLHEVMAISPRTWGWTGGWLHRRSRGIDFPTHVGVDRNINNLADWVS